MGLALSSWGCLGLGGCSAGADGGPPRSPHVAHAPASEATWEGAGLRVSLSELAKTVCVTEQSCPGSARGSVSIRPLEPKLREAITEALRSAGFELVNLEAERDLLADVEWRGTDTIALRLQDAHGRLIDQASYRRSLARCGKLSGSTWDGCWAANFDSMKVELSRPLRESPKLKSFARKVRGISGLESAETGPASLAAETPPSAPASSRHALPEQLDEAALAATINGHRDELERACFTPAFEARADSASSSARVSTVITIQTSGQVADVSTTGDPPGYLHLASCIVAHVRSWRFPAAAKPTVTSVPFVFATESARP